jgi:hypothetical protein
VVTVPDYVLCVHTRAGQEMGRGLLQWWRHGARVEPELDSADHSYREVLIALCGQVEEVRPASSGEDRSGR